MLCLIYFSSIHAGEVSLSISEDLINQYLKIVGDYKTVEKKGKPEWVIQNPHVKLKNNEALFLAKVTYKQGLINIRKDIKLSLKVRYDLKKNELFYFTIFRFIGGGGMPYGIQNVLPVLFDISIKNYFLGTLLGSGPPMFVSVALGAGIENFIEKNAELSFLAIATSQDIYLPVLGFIIIIIISLFLKKFFFKKI